MAWTSEKTGKVFLSLQDDGTFTDPTHLFVDRNRRAPRGWTPIRSTDGFRQHRRVASSGYGVDFRAKVVSVDWQLDGGRTALDIFGEMLRGEWWPEELYLHTADPEGEAIMRNYLLSYAPPGVFRGYGANYWGTDFGPVDRTELPGMST